MKHFHLFIFFRFLSIWSHQIIKCYSVFSISYTELSVLSTLWKRLQTTVTERLYFIINIYVKSRENKEHQYCRIKVSQYEKKIRIGRVVLFALQRQFSSYLCKYNSS